MIKVLKVKDENGQYIDKNNEHFNLIYGAFVKGPRANDFEDFDSLAEAEKHFGLTKVEPEVENADQN